MGESPAEVATRPSLLLRLRDPRDGEAWDTFVGLYVPLIYSYCRQHQLQEADAADVTQEVLAKVVRSLRTFEYQPTRGRFRDWLGAVVRSELCRWYERSRRTAGVPGTGADALLDRLPSPHADAAWVAEFTAHVLRAALARARPHFEPATWRAFHEAWLEGRTAAETALALGVPVESVYLAKSRVLKRLREEILLLTEDLPQFVPLR